MLFVASVNLYSLPILRLHQVMTQLKIALEGYEICWG